MAGFSSYGSPDWYVRTPAQGVLAGVGDIANRYGLDALSLAASVHPATAGVMRGTSLGARALGFLAPDIAAHYIGKAYGSNPEKIADMASGNIFGPIPFKVGSWLWDRLVDPNYSGFINNVIAPVQAKTNTKKR